MFLPAVFAALVTGVLAAPSTFAQLNLLTKYPYARCLDGTQGGYYFQSALSQDSKTKWVFHLQGGGECVTQSSCQSATSSWLGSSKYFTANASLGFFNDPNPSNNPDLWSWNHVMVAYCSQDLHSGQRTETSPETFGLFFSGYHIVHATLNDLIYAHGMGEATDIVVSGDSAGGIGSWYYVDDIAALFPGARVVNAPIAGFYFPAYPYTGPNHTQTQLAPFYPYALQGNFDLWMSHVDADCASAMPNATGQCLLANTSFPYIQSHVFVTESQTDQVVLLYHDWVPNQYITEAPEMAYVTEWHNNMTVALNPVIYTGPTRQNGVFNPACFIHTGFTNTAPLIQGVSYMTAFGNWYFDRPGPVVLQDTCGVFCGHCPT